GPDERDAWLREACGDDENLRSEVSHLLSQDERANIDGFLTPPVRSDSRLNKTESWPPRAKRRPARASEPLPLAQSLDLSDDCARGFCPKAGMAAVTAKQPISEPPSVVRARLRELPIIYIMMVGMATIWRLTVLGYDDLRLYYLDAFVVSALACIIALLSSRL